MRLFVGLVVMLGCVFAPQGAQADTASGVVGNSGDTQDVLDASLTPKGDGCLWRVPETDSGAAGKKKGHKARAKAMVSKVYVDVPCKTVRVVTVRGDGRKAAITAASEGAPKSVQTSPGMVSMVYPLSYRLFEADLSNGKVAELGLPKLKFPADTRPAVAVGYNHRDALVIVATGLTENDNASVLYRFVAGRQGWTSQTVVPYRTDGEQDAQDLCGDNFIIHASLLKNLVNWCVKP